MQKFQIQRSSRVNDLHLLLESMQSTTGGELSEAQVRLDQTPAQTFNPSPLASESVGAGDSLQDIENLIKNDLFTVTVHPWQVGVSTGEGAYSSLSAPNAIKALSNKLRDVDDSYAPSGILEAVSILITATSIQQLYDKLQSFNTVFPVPDLLTAQRRAEQIVRLEGDKLNFPNAAINSKWLAIKSNQLQVFSNVESNLKTLVATSTAAESESNPIAELVALMTKKQSHMAQVNAEYGELQSQFLGGDGYVLSTSGTAQEIANVVVVSTGPQHEFSLCAGVMFVSAVGDLEFIKEVFNAS